MFSFLKDNWLEVGSAIAGLVTLIVGIATYFSGKDGDEADFRFSVDESYERVWSKHNGNPKLARVTDEAADIDSTPVTLEEERFVLLLLNHLTSTLKAIELGKYEKPDGMELDVRDFFRKPIPQFVAKKYLEMQSQKIKELLGDSLNVNE